MQDVLDYIEQHRDEYIALVQRACQQPSISTQNVGIREMAELCREMLADVGADASIVPVDGGFPVVLGQIDGPSRRTLNIYNPYDVQPPEPLDLWESDPFAADVRDGRIWARGVADNKGHLVARICAVDAWRNMRGNLPLTLRFIYEGEEEIGSPNLERFVAEHQSEITPADGCIWEGGGRDFNGRVRLSCGLKGICYVELAVESVNTDMHSSRATIVPNAAWRLVWALNTMKDEQERVLIKGFYDRVLPPTVEEHNILEETPFDEADFLRTFGLERFLLDLAGQRLKLKDMFEPTCTICGVESGYTGDGLKTVLPKAARAKIDMRLVPDQDPHEIARLLRAHLDAHGFSDISVALLAAEHPARTDLSAPLVTAVANAVRRVHGHEPVIVPITPGSGPMYVLCQAIGVPSVSGPGGGNPNSRIHAPNENMYVDDYINAIKGMAVVFDEFARIRRHAGRERRQG
ncbi:MAG TPA: M20/M25/M40 family metallo-hydrolase [Thermomicrobiales bacterium]|nr:M20/M25/M40 family metallo-hydrolase [Thermomicrobiales bacterium]